METIHKTIGVTPLFIKTIQRSENIGIPMKNIFVNALNEILSSEKRLLEYILEIIGKSGNKISLKKALSLPQNEIYKTLNINEDDKILPLLMEKDSLSYLYNLKNDSENGTIVSISEASRIAIRRALYKIINNKGDFEFKEEDHSHNPSYNSNDFINTTIGSTPILYKALRKMSDYGMIESISDFTRKAIKQYIREENKIQKALKEYSRDILKIRNEMDGRVKGLMATFNLEDFTTFKYMSKELEMFPSTSEGIRFALRSYFRKRYIDKTPTRSIKNQTSEHVVEIPFHKDNKKKIYKEFKIIGKGSVNS